MLSVLAVITINLSIFPPQNDPVISEFQAINNHTISDAEGDYSDWIEIYNPGAAINLYGWFLTDDPDNLEKWSFPTNTILPSGETLMIFASSKDKIFANNECHANFKLSGSGEYLALIKSDGNTVVHEYYPKYPAQTPDTAYGIQFNPSLGTEETFFFNTTPNEKNGFGEPVVLEMSSFPQMPTYADKVIIEATVDFAPNTNPGRVQLHYRAAYQNEIEILMHDDGQGDDVVANDGVWTAAIPPGTANSLKMLRWRVTAEDNRGSSGYHPPFLDPIESAEYEGTVIDSAAISSEIPVLHWFSSNPGQTGTPTGTQSSAFYNGRFYDNFHVRRRGASSGTWSKKSYKFDFNRGDHFKYSTGEEEVEEFNLNSVWSDKSYLRQVLCWDTYKNLGVDASNSFMIRVQRSGNFFSLATFVEQPDEDFLEREGLDPNGALYKIFTTLDPNQMNSYSYDKRTRKWEDASDLLALSSATSFTGDQLETWLFDNLDIPAVIAYIAATSIINDNDHVAKNYFLYRDSDGDEEWSFIPWDKDLTLGRNFTPWGGVLNDEIWVNQDPQCHPLFGDASHPKVDNVGMWNRLIDACHRVPRIREMYLRHLRTAMDETLQSPATNNNDLLFENDINELLLKCLPEILLDQAKWGIPSYGDSTLNYSRAIEEIKNDYLAKRRVHLYETHGSLGTGLIPDEQIYPYVHFGTIEHSPISGNDEEEFVQILNSSPTAVDLSNWSIDGGIDFLIPSGTVIPAQDSLYIVRDAQQFRNRSSGPSGGMQLLVIGNYNGHLSNSENVYLYDKIGNLVTTTADFTLAANNFIAGETARCSALQASEHKAVSLVYSLSGSGTTSTPWGDLGLAPPAILAGREIADFTGRALFTGRLPLSLAGQNIWLQAVDMQSRAFSDVIKVIVE